MNKNILDKYFVEILPMVRIIIRGIKYKNKKEYIDEDVLINEAYLHLYNNIDNVNNQDELQRLVINFVSKSLTWTNSKVNKMEKLTPIEEYNTTIPDNYDDELEFKIGLEEWYNEKKGVLSIYRNQETDKIKQIIFDLYFYKNIKKGVDLARHLNINKDYACSYIRILKKDIKLFYEEYKNNNK